MQGFIFIFTKKKGFFFRKFDQKSQNVTIKELLKILLKFSNTNLKHREINLFYNEFDQ